MATIYIAQENHGGFNTSNRYFSKCQLWHYGQFSQIRSHVVFKFCNSQVYLTNIFTYHVLQSIATLDQRMAVHCEIVIYPTHMKISINILYVFWLKLYVLQRHLQCDICTVSDITQYCKITIHIMCLTDVVQMLDLVVTTQPASCNG